MNRIVRFAIRLYPAGWRRRYGTELQTLVEDSGTTWWTVLDLAKGALTMRVSTLWDLARPAVACGLLGACAGALLFFATPTRHASTFTIEVQASDQARPPTPTVVALQAFSDENLVRLVERFGLYPGQPNRRREAGAIRQFRTDISVTMTVPERGIRPTQFSDGQSSVLFRDQGTLHVSFRYPDGHKAREVAIELARLIIDENLRQAGVARYRIAGVPHQIATGPNAMAVTSLGLCAGVLAGMGVATLRRRVQASSTSK